MRGARFDPRTVAPLDLGEVRVWRADDVDEALVRRWCDDWGSWFGPERIPVPGAEEHPRVAWTDTPLGPAIAKREQPQGWRRSLVRVRARGLRSVRAFHAALELRRMGLPTPAPLAALVRRSRQGVEAVLLTRYVDARDPWTFVREGRGTLEEVLDTLAHALAELHDAGFRHRDLKASNVLVGTEGVRPSISWIDLDGLDRPEPLTEAVRVRDLARLCASFETSAAHAVGVRAPTWRSFLERYARSASTGGRSPLHRERTLEATRRWAQRHIERNLTRGRPVT